MNEWSKIKLGNACQIFKGQQLNKIDLEKAGDFPCINGGIEPSGYTDKWNTEANTITISEGGNSCGYVNFITTRFWSGGHCYSLLSLNENIDCTFLYQALKGRESLIMGLRVGSGLPNIQRKAINTFEFDYPTSKSEQTRIAQILSTADKAIEQTEALIAKYQRIKTGLMQDLLTRGIDEQGNIRSKATHKFVVKNGIEVPEEWEVETINQHCESSAFGPRFSGSLYSREGNIATLRTTDIDNEGDINYTSIPFAKLDFKTFEKHLLKENDLLITRSGTVGLVSIYKKQLFQVIPGAFLIRFRLRNSLNPEFLRYYFKNENGRQQLFDIAEGGVQKNIRGSSILKLNVPVPKEDEQIQIINKLHKNEEYISIYLNALYKLQSLKTGLMQDLLSGKVRVKTNPL